MKRLTLLRHAKSSWDDPVERDFDRPLNSKGWRASKVMGEYMLAEKLTFDLLLASPAQRVIETLDGVSEGYGDLPSTRYERRIYLASSVTLKDVVRDCGGEAESLLMVGHNPGLEDLVLELVPDTADDALRAELEIKFPTAAIAEMELDIASWDELADGGARLVRFIRPRDLAEDLGPDHD